MRWVLSLQGGWGAQARSSLHSAQGGGRSVRQEREHGQTGDEEPGGPTRSDPVGTCASLCPSSSPSCWAPSGFSFTEQKLLLPVPPLGAPGSPGLWCRERRECPQVPHPWPCSPAHCSSARGVLGCSAHARGGFPPGGRGKAPPGPVTSSLIPAPRPSLSQGSSPPNHSMLATLTKSLCSNCHTLKKRRVSVIPALLVPIPLFPCSLCGAGYVPALRSQALGDQ